MANKDLLAAIEQHTRKEGYYGPDPCGCLLGQVVRALKLDRSDYDFDLGPTCDAIVHHFKADPELVTQLFFDTCDDGLADDYEAALAHARTLLEGVAA